jgi:hypothetical protein
VKYPVPAGATAIETGFGPLEYMAKPEPVVVRWAATGIMLFTPASPLLTTCIVIVTYCPAPAVDGFKVRLDVRTPPAMAARLMASSIASAMSTLFALPVFSFFIYSTLPFTFLNQPSYI